MKLILAFYPAPEDPPVNKWRERALELFPSLRSEVQAAESVGMLWCELCSRFDAHYEHLDSENTESSALISAIYLYAIWCTSSKSVDTFNAAAIGFYEHVPWHALRCNSPKYQLIVEDIVKNIGMPEIKRMAGVFGYLLKPDQFTKFLADCGKADRDLCRRLQR